MSAPSPLLTSQLSPLMLWIVAFPRTDLHPVPTPSIPSFRTRRQHKSFPPSPRNGRWTKETHHASLAQSASQQGCEVSPCDARWLYLSPEKHKSMDWFKGKSAGNHGFYHQISGFPVNFPIIQLFEQNIRILWFYDVEIDMRVIEIEDWGIHNLLVRCWKHPIDVASGYLT